MGNGSYNVSLPMILKKKNTKNLSWSNTSISMYTFTVSPYIMILDSGLCFDKCAALFLG